MKNKIYLTLGMASLLVLAGCSSTAEIKDSPEVAETVTYNHVKYTNDPNQPNKDNPYIVSVIHNGNGQAQHNPYGNTPTPMGGQQQVVHSAQHQVQPTGGNAPVQQAASGNTSAPIITSEPKVVQQQVQPQPQVQQVIVQKQEPRKEKIKITGVGYGAESTYEGFTQGQRRLMAIRASKLDAYRALAEQLYGIKIDSNTSVATLTAQSDSFRARVNAVVKGARIVSITPMADNNYETVLEVFVDRTFFEDVFVYTGNKHDHVLEAIETCTMGFNCYEAASYR